MKFYTLAAALGLAASTQACLLQSEIDDEREFSLTGLRPNHFRRSVSGSSSASSTFPIGSGDRFATTTPVGLGVKDRDLQAILNVAEATSALKSLERAYPGQLKLFTPPFKTFEGRQLPGVAFGDNPRVFIMSGIHARERGGPDNVIYFLADLLAAHKAGTGVKYGSLSYTAKNVETALSAGLVIMPLTNPDGVAYDQKTGQCWRKNRNPKSSSSGRGDDVGVDLNRNFDFVWDYQKAFDPDAGSPASDDPSSETFYGTSAASEPETKSVVWALDQYPNITWFLDLHSNAGTLLYGWGDDDVGTQDTAQNFLNPKYDGKRGDLGDNVYKEYMTSSDWDTEKKGVSAMLKGLKGAGKTPYSAAPAVDLYPTSGASNDYARGRYYGKLACGSSRMFGLTLEFGGNSNSDPGCSFYPNSKEYHDNIRQVAASFMEMALYAAGPAGNPIILNC